MSDAPKLFPDSPDDLPDARLDASSALVGTRRRDDEQRLDSYVNRLSDRIGRRVTIDCDDAPVTVAYDVEDKA